MANALRALLLNILLIISFSAASADNPFTIYLDGGQEIANLRKDLNDMENNTWDLMRDMKARFDKLDASFKQLGSNVQELVTEFQKMKENMKTTKSSCTVKSDRRRNYNL